MGMFDTLRVHKSLLSKLVEENKLELKYEEDYYDFQTKDLENLLELYFLEENKKLILLEQKYKLIPEEERSNKPFAPYMEEDGEPVRVESTFTGYIQFYDFYDTDVERIFVTFRAHVVDGNLNEDIEVLNIERMDLRAQAEQAKEARKFWDAVHDTWQWQVLKYIRSVKWFCWKHIGRRFQKLEEYLDVKSRERASKIAPDPLKNLEL